MNLVNEFLHSLFIDGVTAVFFFWVPWICYIREGCVNLFISIIAFKSIEIILYESFDLPFIHSLITETLEYCIYYCFYYLLFLLFVVSLRCSILQRPPGHIKAEDLITGPHAKSREPIASAQTAVVNNSLSFLINDKPQITSFLIVMHFYLMLIIMDFLLAVGFTFVVRIQKTVIKSDTKWILNVITTLSIKSLQLSCNPHKHKVVSKPTLLLNTCRQNCKAVMAQWWLMTPLCLSWSRVEVVFFNVLYCIVAVQNVDAGADLVIVVEDATVLRGGAWVLAFELKLFLIHFCFFKKIN